MRRILALAVLALLAAASPASGHAVLERSVPERGAVLDAAPAAVELRFDEPVEIAFGAVRVFGADGDRVEQGKPYRPGGDARRVAVALRDGLPDGAYTVTYRVVSADAHPVQGGYVFSVGDGTTAGATVGELLDGQDAGPVTSVAFAAARAAQFGAITLGLGVLAAVGAAWLPAVRRVSGAADAWRSATAAFAARVRKLLLVAGAAGALSAGAGLALQAATASGDSVWAASGEVGAVLDTRFGLVWGAGGVAWLAVLALTVTRAAALPALRPATLGAAGSAAPHGARGLAPLAVPLVALALLPGLGGHAGAQAPVAVLLPANVAHVLAAGAWIGGLAVLLLALPAATRQLAAEDRTRVLAATLERFSTLALVAVAVLLAGGIAQALLGLGDPGDLWSTGYGRAILLKAALVVVLLAIGALNRRRVVPGLRQAAAGDAPPGAAGRLLRRTLRAEVALGAAALAATGALAGSPPATALQAGPYAASAAMGPARAELTVEPARTGANEIHLYLFDRADGRQYDAPQELRLEASLPERGIEGQQLQVTKAGPGHYVARGALLSPSGEWRLEVVARTSEFDELRSTFDVPIE